MPRRTTTRPASSLPAAIVAVASGLLMALALAAPRTVAARPGNDPDPNAIPAPPDVGAPPANATRTGSGLAYRVLRRGGGVRHPTRDEDVEVHYTGWTTDGRMIESSVARGHPARFRGTRVIEGFAEALELMVVGEKIRVWIPADLAYGNRPGRPQGMLVFDIELLRIL